MDERKTMNYAEHKKDEFSIVRAHTQSKIFMAIGSLWIMSLTLAKGFGFFEMEVKDIILSGLAITATYSPTYLSTFMDKATEMFKR